MNTLVSLFALWSLAQPMGHNPAVLHEDGRRVWLFDGSNVISFPSTERLVFELRFHRGRPGCDDAAARIEVEQSGRQIAVVIDALEEPPLAAGYRDFQVLASRPMRIDVPASGGRTTFRLRGGTCGGSVTHVREGSAPRATKAARAPTLASSSIPRKHRARPFRSPATLIAAAKSGDLATVKKQLASGTDVNATTGELDAQTALGWAAYRGHRDVAKFLLEQGARIDAQNRRGYTALMAAAQGGHTELVRSLLERGANPNLATRNGDTALIYAAMFGNTEMIRALLEAGAASSVENALGDTAEALATALGRSDIAAVLAPR